MVFVVWLTLRMLIELEFRMDACATNTAAPKDGPDAT